ncbi:MAG: PepSY domain-containing protein, partial [Phycisphaerae bacterium]
MQWRRGTFAVHRWMGLVVSLQLLAWSVGGFVFSILDIDNVRGDLDKRINPPPSLSMDRVAVTPWVAHGHAVFGGVSADKIARIVLKERFGSPVYDFYGSGGRPLTSVDAVTGELRPRVPAERVAEVALADFVHPASVTSVTLLEGEPPSEYRGGVMPVYQVILDHPKRPHLYICPVTGKVLKRRNRPWRVFDFFWML